ncbi:hypothetical protein CcCBS67573_g00513 [Chytriomyces confervae]|uniref:CinA C-terminal domain-containing protein n=1 Tax=Chytriomyces confervae TaxID=246404 RepID=A0A507FPN1_9FUNG|nr:hypothetical protein CcCBS67573_g00513 [Chytriomyces confervae]
MKSGEQQPRSTTLQQHATKILQTLKLRNETIGTAESLTGGLVSAALTDIPGSSAVMKAGVVAYSNETKAHLLGVSLRVLDSVGPVSFECAKGMAEGALQACKTDWAIATTGFAGNITESQLESEQSPPPQQQDSRASADGNQSGLVFIHVCGPRDISLSRRLQFCSRNTRTQNRVSAVESALELMVEALETAMI